MKNIPTIICISLMIAFLALGCLKQPAEQQEAVPEIVWPNAPETPRIRFAGFVSSPEDLKIEDRAFRKIIAYLFGDPERTMVTPYGVATDSAERLYVVDTGLKTVHVYDVDGKKYYQFTAKKFPFKSPIDIAIDEKGERAYVSDSGAKVVKVFELRNHSLVGEIGRGVLERPTGLSINQKTSELLVVDTPNGSILRYGLGDGRFKGVFGGHGAGTEKFHYPTSIFATGDGRVLVTDSLNFRIQVLSSEGALLGTIGSEGAQPGYFTRPKGVAADSDGNIYVVDALFDNVQMFDSQGRLLMAFGGRGHGYGEFWLPTGIFIDPNDRIYVSDSYHKRVQIFEYLKGGRRLQ